MSAQMWQTIAVAGFILSAVFLLASVIIFFMFNIPGVMADLHGKKRISSVQISRNKQKENGNSQRWYTDKPQATVKVEVRHTVAPDQHGTDQASETRRTTALIKNGEAEEPRTRRTTALFQDDTEKEPGIRKTTALSQTGEEESFGSRRTMALTQVGAEEETGTHRTTALSQTSIEEEYRNYRTTALTQAGTAGGGKTRRTTALGVEEYNDLTEDTVPAFHMVKSVVVIHSAETID